MSFDDLSKKQQKEILKIADKKIAVDKVVKKHNNEAYKVMKATFKKFLSRDGEFTEDQVPTNTIKYKKKKVSRVQDLSGQYIERCMVTLDNNYQISITRPAQTYDSDPNLFDISPRQPDGELDTTLIDNTQINQDVLPGQSVQDINKHIKTVAKLDPDEYLKKQQNEDEKPKENIA